MKTTVAVFFAFALSTNLAAAQSTNGNVVSGAGATSCGQYLKNSASNNEDTWLVITWAQGFLSGMNIARKNEKLKMVLLPDADSIRAYIDKYCRESPLESPFWGSIQLFQELQK